MKNFEEMLVGEPAYRVKQIYQAWFEPGLLGYETITTLPVSLRQKLANEPWLTVEPLVIKKSKVDETQKALLKLADGAKIETVLMRRINLRQDSEKEFRYTVCLSTQVGCAMNCAFCATGKLGFNRNLSAKEIVDQFRFWQIKVRQESGGGIENIVLMGQGEPLANFDEVKKAIQIFIDYAKIGQTKITVSTVGIVSGLNKIIEDQDFPPVRVAISLHSAIDETRTKLIPSHSVGFFDYLVSWAKKYHQKFSSRTHFIGLEYIMLAEINDDARHLKALIKLASKMGLVRINLISFNSSSLPDKKMILAGSPNETIKNWQQKIMQAGLVCTIRNSQGTDIAAACGQLALQNK